LLEELTGAWKHSHASVRAHHAGQRCRSYHALFIQRSLMQAGFETKILHGLGALSWDAAGQLIDDEGRHVNCVWKTWAWETAIEQIREVSETEYAAVPIRPDIPRAKCA
jgi:glutathionylspermidine amidase/synthetase